MNVSESRIEHLLRELTLEEKISLCHASGKFSVGPVDRLGIPEFWMSDGPHGVRQELERTSWKPLNVDWDFSVYLPVGVALASTWNRELARWFGEVLGSEARARRKDVILGPGLNVMRNPLCGRNFEYLSEDPYLISAMAPQVVLGIQSQDTAACAKHFALNNQELNRHGVDACPDERTLREIYLPGFEACVKLGGVLTVMGAYNKYFGQWCCHNKRLLCEILKDEWGFEGSVISDWGGCHDGDEAIAHGLDIEMGTAVARFEDYHLARPYLEKIKRGDAGVEELNDKVRRNLRVMMRIGLLDEVTRQPGEQLSESHCLACRTIAEEAVVLLKNEAHLLPFDAGKIKKLAIIGENADMKFASGGGSSGVKARYEITPLEGLKKRFGDHMEITYAKGYPEQRMCLPAIPSHHLMTIDEASGIKGWKVEWFCSHSFEQEAVCTEFRDTVDLSISGYQSPVPGTRDAWWAVRCSAKVVAPKSGVYSFGMASDGWARLLINGEHVIHYEQSSPNTLHRSETQLETGRVYALCIEYGHGEADASLAFGWLAPGETFNPSMDLKQEALVIAREADAVIFCGGLNHYYDNEGIDRLTMALEGGQNELIEELAAINPNLAVLLIGGGPVEMPWINHVKAVLMGWYAGMDAGLVFADCLFGKVNPSGKLPVTFPRTLSDCPHAQLNDYQRDICAYREGVFVGHRWYEEKGIEPLFSFGHGLSYTTFTYSNLQIQIVQEDAYVVRVRCHITNTGNRIGKEVVQLYVSDSVCSVKRPVKELKGFQKVEVSPWQTVVADFGITRRDLSYWSVEENDWRLEAGEFGVQIGASSADIRLVGSFTL